VHAAVLDLHLHGATVFKLADTLQERGIPFVFATGYNRDVIPTRFADVPYFPKPLSPSQIAERLRSLVLKPRTYPVREPDTKFPVCTEEPVVVFARAIARSLVR
jgi:CheY-like chemotaxis protein